MTLGQQRIDQLTTEARTYRMAAQIVPADVMSGGLRVRDIFNGYAVAKDTEARELASC